MPLEIIVCVLRSGNTLGVLYISYSVADDQRNKYSPRLVRTRKSRWFKYGVLSSKKFIMRAGIWRLLNGLGARVAERGQSCRVFCQTVSRQPPYIVLPRWICPYYIKVAKRRKHSQNNNNRIKRMGEGVLLIQYISVSQPFFNLLPKILPRRWVVTSPL